MGSSGRKDMGVQLTRNLACSDLSEWRWRVGWENTRLGGQTPGDHNVWPLGPWGLTPPSQVECVVCRLLS